MDTLTQIANGLAGEFDNREQAIADPTWFVHLRLWHRPLPFQVDGCLALFAEQANVLYVDQPYRQRVLILRPTSTELGQVEYRALRHPEQWRGAGAHESALQTLQPDDLVPLPGCILTLTQQAQGFRAEPPPDARCYFQYEGKTRQVVLGFELECNIPGSNSDRFRSFDRGVDPETGQSLWGALMGPYEFVKRQQY